MSDFWLVITKLIRKKVSQELMSIAWHPKRWWNFRMSEDKKKKLKALLSNPFNIYNMEVLKHFATNN